MPYYAQLTDGVVTSVTETAESLPPAANLIKIDGLYFELLGTKYEGTQFVPSPRTPEQVKQEIIDAVQNRLDAFARTRNYDGILSACTYAGSTVPKFATEGQYAINARDATWAACYQIMTAVQNGTRPLPGVSDVLAELPALAWPN
jgi:hypothetical protein